MPDPTPNKPRRWKRAVAIGIEVVLVLALLATAIAIVLPAKIGASPNARLRGPFGGP